jgi:hypothetical protein
MTKNPCWWRVARANVTAAKYDGAWHDEVQLFTYVSQGYSYAEIARQLNTSERAIEERIYRARAKARPFLPRGWGEM